MPFCPCITAGSESYRHNLERGFIDKIGRHMTQYMGISPGICEVSPHSGMSDYEARVLQSRKPQIILPEARLDLFVICSTKSLESMVNNR